MKLAMETKQMEERLQALRESMNKQKAKYVRADMSVCVIFQEGERWLPLEIKHSFHGCDG